MNTSERVATTCPACSPGVETVHEVVSPGGQATVRCTDCGHVHKTRIETPSTDDVDVVVSRDGESESATAEVPVEEHLSVGEEFLLEDGDLLATVRITSLELATGERVDEAEASEVRTIWGRAVDNVAVNVTVHPKEGGREDTRSVKLGVPGDHEFVVGESETHGDESFTVEQVLVREDAVGYDHEQLDRRGDGVAAKDVKRVFVRDETGDAWSAW